MKIQEIVKDGMSTKEILNNLKTRVESMDKKAQYMIDHLPDIVVETIRKGEEAYHGMIKLPGTGGIPEFVGNPPVWLERRHNDNEFLWQLNRMTHWQPMLEAYSLTKDSKYATKVIEEMLNWMENVEISEKMENYPLAYFTECNPLRALEMGIRTYKTWPLVIEHLVKSDLFTEELLEKYLITVYKQAKLLYKFSPLLWPNADHNHFLMECLGILTTALYFPELKEAEVWRKFAMEQLERCAKAQLTREGGQIEGCPSYHNGCMFWFGLTLVLSNRFNFNFSKEYVELYRKSLDYSMYCFRPTGKTVPVGDSHANNLSIMASVFGYLAFDEITWFNFLNKLISKDEIWKAASEYIWRVPNVEKFHKDMKFISSDAGDYKLETVFWNKDLNQAMIRSDWGKEALSFLFICRTPIQNAHGHIDAMSFDFSALEKNMICDPGIFCYRDDEDRKAFKTAAYHSTITIDGKDHFEYKSSFEFGPQKQGEIVKVEKKEFYSYASACHKNYDPILHKRHIAMVEDSFLVVVDQIENLDRNSIQMYYHLDFTKVTTSSGQTIGKDSKANIVIFNNPQLKASLLPGRLSDVNDIYRDSTRLLLEDQAKDEGEKIYTTILIPYQGEKNPNIENVMTVKNKDTIEITFKFKKEYKIIVRGNDFSMIRGE